MLSVWGRPVAWAMIGGLVVVLGMGGCARKNIMATSTGAEAQQAKRADSDARSGGKPGRGEVSQNFGTGGSDREGAGGLGTLEGSGSGLGREGSAGDAGKSERGGEGKGDRFSESLGSIGNGPLQGFDKGKQEERLAVSPLIVAKAEPQEIEARRSEERAKRELRELKDVYFAYDKWALSNEGMKNLSESADFLRQNPGVKIYIEGHCDERGSRDYNLVLGEKRAKEVRRYLADLGIKNPVIVNSYGKERPVCQEHDESCYSKNRRAHLLVEGGQ